MSPLALESQDRAGRAKADAQQLARRHQRLDMPRIAELSHPRHEVGAIELRRQCGLQAPKLRSRNQLKGDAFASPLLGSICALFFEELQAAGTQIAVVD